MTDWGDGRGRTIAAELALAALFCGCTPSVSSAPEKIGSPPQTASPPRAATSDQVPIRKGAPPSAAEPCQSSAAVQRPEVGSSPPSIHGTYPWHDEVNSQQTVGARVLPPPGFRRVDAEPGSFADWLRTLPVKPGRPEVHLYDGSLKGNQSAQALVIDMDVGNRDLQQCADAVMRLRAEYLYSLQRFEAIHFNFTTGDRASYSKWRQGYRPKIEGNKVSWGLTGPATTGYKGFRSYLTSVFTYAGTASLTRELGSKDVSAIAPGDVFIRGGYPGHAVIVVDVAKNEAGAALFLLAQSYMPAQEMHVLRNPSDAALSPWYSTDFGDVLETPEWNFKRDQLKYFKD